MSQFLSVLPSPSVELVELSAAIVPPNRGRSRSGLPADVVDDPIGQIRHDIWESLPFRHLVVSSETTKEDIVEAYCVSHELLVGHFEEAKEFVREICACNTFTEEGVQRQNLARIKSREVARITEPYFGENLPSPEGFGADVFYLEKNELHNHLYDGLAKTHDYWLATFLESMMSLAKGGLLGTVRWTVPGVCDLLLAQRTISRTVTDTRLDREYVRRHSDITVEAEVMLHSLMRCSISRHLKKAPPNAISIWKKIPVWLKPYVEVVDGEMINEGSKKQVIDQRRTSTQVYSPLPKPDAGPLYHQDPAITVFGTVVLTLWDAHADNIRDIPQPPKCLTATEQVEVGVNLAINVAAVCCGIGLFLLAIWNWSGLYLMLSFLCFATGGLCNSMIRQVYSPELNV